MVSPSQVSPPHGLPLESPTLTMLITSGMTQFGFVSASIIIGITDPGVVAVLISCGVGEPGFVIVLITRVDQGATEPGVL